MADDTGSASGKTLSGSPQRPMNFPDASHPIFSRPIVIGPGAIWRTPTNREVCLSQRGNCSLPQSSPAVIDCQTDSR